MSTINKSYIVGVYLDLLKSQEIGPIGQQEDMQGLSWLRTFVKPSLFTLANVVESC